MSGLTSGTGGVLQVHSGCKDLLSSKCPLGQCKVSVIPPTALNSIDSDGEILFPHLFMSIQEIRSY